MSKKPPVAPTVEEEKIDDKLMKEIEDYLGTVMQNNDPAIEMADNEIRSDGAQCVAAAIEFCTSLVEIKLSNCKIGDAGAITLFDCIGSKSSTI